MIICVNLIILCLTPQEYLELIKKYQNPEWNPALQKNDCLQNRPLELAIR